MYHLRRVVAPLLLATVLSVTVPKAEAGWAQAVWWSLRRPTPSASRLRPKSGRRKLPWRPPEGTPRSWNRSGGMLELRLLVLTRGRPNRSLSVARKSLAEKLTR